MSGHITQKSRRMLWTQIQSILFLFKITIGGANILFLDIFNRDNIFYNRRTKL